MSPLTVIVVDDEPPARMLLREYLAADPTVEVLAECANGFEAVRAVAELRPDVLLLDVQMPRHDGFEVMELVGRETAVIFVTAHDEYAIKAFDVHAVDYLLKPVSPERLQEALTRARLRLRAPAPTWVRPAGSHPARVVVRAGSQVHVVPLDRLDYVEAQDDYIALHTAGRTLLKEQTLSDLEARLDPRRFVRIHRSYLLNLDRLAGLEPAGKDSRVAVLRDGTRLPVSRSGYARLDALL